MFLHQGAHVLLNSTDIVIDESHFQTISNIEIPVDLGFL